MTTVPRPMGMTNMVATVKALMAAGLPRVPRTIHLHVGLFSQIHDMPEESDQVEKKPRRCRLLKENEKQNAAVRG